MNKKINILIKQESLLRLFILKIKLFSVYVTHKLNNKNLNSDPNTFKYIIMINKNNNPRDN